MTFRRDRKQNKNSGFTLVEMIVVLVILGILASVAVYSIINYINMTRYNNNQQNAISIFQSAHSSLNHMSEAGTLEDWCKDVIGEKGLTGSGDIGIGTPDGYDASNTVAGGPIDNMYHEDFFNAFPEGIPYSHVGQSAHMRYAVTYTPHPVGDTSLLTPDQRTQTQLIEDLIGKDFNSTELFNGVITIEFDIEKTIDTSGTVRFSADVFAVFYDSKRTSWDSTAYNRPDTNVNITEKVPYRDEDYRRTTSFVGYASGKNGAVAVDTVFIPADAEIKETLFTLRNGETLDLTWSAKTGTTPVTGKPDHIHYVFSLYDNDGNPGANKICDLVVNESSILGGIPKNNTAMGGQDSFYDKLKFDKSTFTEGMTNSIPITTDKGTSSYTVVYTSERITNEKNIPIVIYRASITDTAKVFVQRGNNALDYSFNKASNPANYYNFPITISYEIYEVSGTTISERISYSLSLDAMMSCNLIQYDKSHNDSFTARTLDYSINRLINNSNKLLTDKFPVNIYATMTAENDDFGTTHSDYNGSTLAALSPIYAERALDDPVFMQTDGSGNGQVSYSYFEHAVIRELGKEYAVVNSYFADLDAGSFGSKLNIGNDEIAGITCYRHLYNIRMLEGSSVNVQYKIMRNLNWYLSYENSGTKYLSEVVVYSPVGGGSGISGFSPVPVPAPSSTPGVPSSYYGRVLNVVSFPSIPKLKSGSTLIAVDNTISRLPAGEDKTSVINNLQMRMESFYTGGVSVSGENISATQGVANDLNGYGMINTNEGTIINIRANNMTLILTNLANGFTTADGTDKDLEGINSAISNFINPATTNIQTSTVVGFQNSSPLGGLVGRNNGSVGSDSVTDPQKNTIRFSNCIVSSMYNDGGTWKLYRLSACSGVVGDNYGNLYGHLESTGHFAYLGWIDVAGTVGYSERNVDALLYVDNTKDTTAEAYLNIDDVSSVIMGTADSVGGALGYLNTNGGNSNHLCQHPDGIIDPGAGKAVDANGIPTFFAVDVKLDENSYILVRSNDDIAPKNTNNRPGGIGGAIGRLTNYANAILSVQVDNSGVIVSTEGTVQANGTVIERHLGGAIGIMNGGNASNVYIKVENRSNIGTFDRTSDTAEAVGYCRTTGGAVGRIRNFTNENGIYKIEVVNDHGVFGNSYQNMNYTGVGGAVGAIANDNGNNIPRYIISSVNNGSVISINRSPGNADTVNTNGTIGVGGLIGCVRYLGRGSDLNCQMADGTQVKSAGPNAGGVIGIQSDGMGNNNATEQTSVKVTLNNNTITAAGANAGGVIGSAKNVDKFSINADIKSTSITASGDNAGGCIGYAEAIESTTAALSLNTSPITASGQNAGGCIGYAKKYSSDTVLETKITGTIRIKASANVGGIAGRMTSSTTTGSALKLIYADTSSALEIATATPSVPESDNAGGLIGYLNTNNVFQPVIVFPNTLKIAVDCYDNAGGFIGKMEASGHDVTISDISFTLHPASHIIAYGNNAGGAFGTLTIGADFTPDITITGDPELITSGNNAPVITAVTSNAGGIIGNLTGKGTLSSDLTLSCTGRLDVLSNVIGIKILSTSNLGGCIGNIKGNDNNNSANNIKLNGNIVLSGQIIALSCADHVGGVIGNSTYVTFNGDITSEASNLTVSATGSYAGGCIGRMESGKVSDTASITYSGAYSIVSGAGYTGGCIGTATGVGSISGKILHTGDNAHITGTGEYTGGIIGYSYNCKFYSTELGFSGNHAAISGTDHTGGIIGGFIADNNNNNGSINDHSILTFSGNGSVISGQNNVGGIIGYSNKGNINGTTELTYKPEFYGTPEGANYPCSIIGSGTNVGGVIGYFGSANINNSVKLSYQSVGTQAYPSTIIGSGNNVGGVFGEVLSGKSNSSTSYTYTGQYTSIKGQDNVGGIIGISDTYFNGGTIQFAPQSECRIEGKDNVGGIAGLGSSRNGDGNLHTKPTVFLSGCVLTIQGSGYTGGIIGSAINNCYYSGGTIEAKSNSTLNITSTSSAAAGNVGRIVECNMGDGSTVTITVRDTSKINIKGLTAAGGCIGVAGNENKLRFKRNSFNISITLASSDSQLNIEATGDGAGAGGVIGLNYDMFGRKKDNGIVGLTSGDGKFTVKATGASGYAGAIIGINYGEFTAVTGRNYKINITTLLDSRTLSNPSSTTAPAGYTKPGEDWLIGRRAPGSSAS
ncbi:MAG: prepilin-type N-terminal cleavage/methylation domain-containing protein, partial [Lachnospiraceae bacterium]|nr:prepilin-type N-terminal cleavage/methylation domain-containing protein [Lachnospiraceae bacterium]